MARTRRQSARDDGLTVVEILVAITVLFIAVTAMLPMLLQTTNSASQAKVKTVLTNAISSYVEEVRALPYEQIAIVGTAPDASVDATRQVTVGGYSIDMTATIVAVDDPDLEGTNNYKELVVTARALLPGGRPMTSTVSTYVWGVQNQDLSLPTVAFTIPSPSEGDIVDPYETVSAQAGVTASGARITKVEFTLGSILLRDAFGGFASFSPGTESWADSFSWYTVAKDIDDALVFVDGPQVLKVQVWDNFGNTTYVTRTVIVDNLAPDPCTDVALVAQGPTSLQGTWNQATDGVGYAASYNYRLHASPLTYALPAEWPAGSWVNVSASGASITASPFTRYYLDVQPVSTGGIAREDWVSSDVTVTNPLLGGTYTQTITEVTKNKTYRITTNVTASTTTPQFSVTGAATYDVFRATSLAALAQAVQDNSPIQTVVVTDPGAWTQAIADSTLYALSKSNARVYTPTYYYQVRVTYTPEGEAEASILSSVSSVPGLEVTGARTASGTMVQQ